MDEVVILQMNHFGSLHNGKTIFFSHMERLPKIFDEISSSYYKSKFFIIH